MGIVNLSDLTAGMVLASSIHNFQNVLLLNKGSKITDKHILIFKSWGVMEADIEGVEQKGTHDEFADIDKDTLLSIERELEARFADVQKNEVVAEIMRITKKQMIGKILNATEV